MKHSVGIFGRGRWANIIIDKIKNDGFGSLDLKFIADSKTDINQILDKNKIDWAIIATPNETHYSIAKILLQKGINVFCEKPLTSYPDEVKELYVIAKENNVHLYVDDVFLWRENLSDITKKLKENKTNSISTSWLKNDGQPNARVLVDDLAYHHLYITAVLTGFDKSYKISANISKDSLFVDIKFPDKSFSMHFSKNYKDKVHKFSNLDLQEQQNDALKDMLSELFSGNVDYVRNKKISLWCCEVAFKIKQLIMPKVSIIGGGIFGCTAAIELANQGCDVTIYEKERDILLKSTSLNQLRLHRGYHYPRSLETAKSSKNSFPVFNTYFEESIKEDSARHFYGISAKNSNVNSNQYETFLKAAGLEYSIINESDKIYNLLDSSKFERVFEAKEKTYDPKVLRRLCKKKLRRRGVKLVLNKTASTQQIPKNHIVVTATYAYPTDQRAYYQFEICEKLVVKMPKSFKNISFVVMDGPFTSIDPLPGTDHHLMGHVTHAIHSTNNGNKPIVPLKLRSLVDKGYVKNPKVTNFEKFKKASSYFFPELDKMTHVASQYMVRTVLAHRDEDDARPTLIHKISDKHYDIFSGKVGTAPKAALELVRKVLYEQMDRVI